MPEKKKHNTRLVTEFLVGAFSRFLFYCVVLFIFVGDLIILFASSIAKFFAISAESLYEVFIDSIKGIHILIQYIGDGVIGIAGYIRKLVVGVLSSVQKALNHGIKPFSVIGKALTRITPQGAFFGMKKKRPVGRPPKKSRSDISWELIRLRFRYFLLGALATLMIIGIEMGYSFVSDLPNPKLIGNVNFPVSTQIYDRNGNLLYDVFRDQDRTPVHLKELPPHIVQATLAIEDRNFYNHNGISLIGGVLRAVKDTWRTGDLQGGSTITQQLVKSSLLTPERTIERKVKEAILAIWTERIYTKDEILEMYLNQVAYGGTAYGIEEAAKTYFNKPARELTVNESAFLAGLTRAPSTYSPYVNPQRAIERRNEVLKSMVETGYISDNQYNEEVQRDLDVEPPKVFIRAPHFVFYVKSLLEEKYGIRRVEEGGLRVVTTLDLNLQAQLETILKEELAKIENLNVTNGAILVTSPGTGEILAMVGSKNYFEEPYGAFNVTTAQRQPGSSIKPIMYSLAIESGRFTPASIIDDAPVVYTIPGARPYRPVNYDNKFHGPVPLRYALANSYNVPAVKVLNEIGVQNFIQHAERMGISTWNTPERYGLSLTLGGAEVKMTDMAVAFGVFANYGDRVGLNPILAVEDFRGDMLETFTVSKTSGVLSPETSFIMADILSDNDARRFAFGTQSDLVIPGYKVAVKTGTTNDKRDNWTNGFTRKYFVGVWVGNNDNTPMNPILTSGVTGASPIWNRSMKTVLEQNIDVTADVQPSVEFSVPASISTKQCYFGKIEYFKAGTERQDDCSGQIFGTPQPSATPPRNSRAFMQSL